MAWAVCGTVALHAQAKGHICYISPLPVVQKAQSETSDYYTNYYKTATHPEEVEVIETDFNANDVATLYLDSIKKVFQQFQQPCVIRNFDQKNAKSYMHDQLYHVIDIDRQYYENKFISESEKKAVLIYVIAHEYSHCMRGDAMYVPNSSRYTLYGRELEADEEAGFALGKLTSVDIDFIDRALPLILGKNARTESHPDVIYRIIAVKCGWIRAKTADLPDQGTVTVGGRLYKKTFFKESNYSGQVTKDGVWDGPVEKKSSDLKSIYFYINKAEKTTQTIEIISGDHIYMGNMLDGKRNDTGFVAIESGSWFYGSWLKNAPLAGEYHFANGDVYDGQYENQEHSGWGMYTTKEGEVYIGRWNDGKKEGKGVLYKGKTVINQGIWKNDEFCPDCKE